MKWFILNSYLQKNIFQRKTIRFAKYFLLLITAIALLAPVICNEKPLYVKYRGENLFPALSLRGYADVLNPRSQQVERIVYSMVDWRTLGKEKVTWCPVAYSAGKSDRLNTDYKSPLDVQFFYENGEAGEMPLRYRHWLGTTKTGADVLSGIIYGARTSLTVGIFSMLIAGLIGIAFGTLAGFFGDYKILVSKTGFIAAVVFGLPLSYFYGIYIHRFSFHDIFNTSILYGISFFLYILILILSIIFLFYFAGKLAGKVVHYPAKIFLRIDLFVVRIIEVFNSIPRIILIITLSALTRPSVLNLVVIIGLTSWTEIARLVRAEMLRIRESEYIQSAEASGIKIMRLVLKHALPNAITPAMTAITLGVASAILTESALSFLGIGVPSDIVTWGSLLNEGRQNFSAWWLVLFPGLAIFTTVSAINIMGDALNETRETH